MIVVYCDGLCEPCNPGGTATYGWVAYKDGRRIAEECAVVCSGPEATNNVAEYSAISSALEWLIHNDYCSENLRIKSDSQLCIYQLNGNYAVRSARIFPLYKRVKDLSRKFKKIDFQWIPREKNKEADTLSRKAYLESLNANGGIEARRQRAMDIIDNIVCIGQEKYQVRSQSGSGAYIVNMITRECTCPDYVKKQQKIGGKCKHILAVEIFKQKTEEYCSVCG